LDQTRHAVARDEPWGVELMLGYLQAVEEYIERYGVRIEAGSETKAG
jgi:hypothetical protein